MIQHGGTLVRRGLLHDDDVAGREEVVAERHAERGQNGRCHEPRHDAGDQSCGASARMQTSDGQQDHRGRKEQEQPEKHAKTDSGTKSPAMTRHWIMNARLVAARSGTAINITHSR